MIFLNVGLTSFGVKLVPGMLKGPISIKDKKNSKITFSIVIPSIMKDVAVGEICQIAISGDVVLVREMFVNEITFVSKESTMIIGRDPEKP